MLPPGEEYYTLFTDDKRKENQREETRSVAKKREVGERGALEEDSHAGGGPGAAAWDFPAGGLAAPQERKMFEAHTLKLVEGEVMYLTGATLNAMGAENGCYELMDVRGFFVEDEKFYKLTADGIEEVE